MKKILVLFLSFFVFGLPVFSTTYKTSEDYLKGKKHPFAMNIVGENIVKPAIKKALKKEAPGKYKIKFKSYTLSSLKKGIFKYFEVTGRNIRIHEIRVPYFNARTVTDYNWIDYNQKPIIFKSDMEFDYVLHLSEDSINDALKTEEYQKILRKINKRVYPLFTLNSVLAKIKNNRIYIIMNYNFPLSPRETDRTFMVSSKLNVVNNEIVPRELSFDSAYGNLPFKKVANLINLLNPLNFTVKLIDDKKGNVKIGKIEILDDIVVINGKIYVKGEK